MGSNLPAPANVFSVIRLAHRSCFDSSARFVRGVVSQSLDWCQVF
jgi:hypothetical protein